MNAAGLVREARLRHRLDQRSLALRAGTSQAQISRIERGATSPTVETLSHLLAVMGERLDLRAEPGPRGNQSTADLRADFERLAPGERVAQAAELSHALTSIAARRPGR